jgi:hypothetical protein
MLCAICTLKSLQIVKLYCYLCIIKNQGIKDTAVAELNKLYSFVKKDDRNSNIAFLLISADNLDKCLMQCWILSHISKLLVLAARFLMCSVQELY